MPLRVFAVCGTRPDAIKMAPVILELNGCPDIETFVIASGQHKEILQQVFDQFSIKATINLSVMKHGQSLADLTAAILQGFDGLIEEHRPSLIVAQGDTTTTLCAGLSAFYRKLPFAHVEAGLRTSTIDTPFPEEFNRRAVGLFARMNFPPTNAAAANLLSERVPPERVFVTGNTAIDALLRVAQDDGEMPEKSDHRIVLVTTHRRENWGEPQKAICRAVNRMLEAVADIRVVLPMHPNPIVREVIEPAFAQNDRVSLIEPPEYGEFAKLMKRAHLILTDSGGIQEEAPAFGKPVLVLRDETERPEGIQAGNAKLVGAHEDRIFSEAHTLLTDSAAYTRMAKIQNPYGDGRAAVRIVSKIREFLGLPFAPVEPFTGG